MNLRTAALPMRLLVLLSSAAGCWPDVPAPDPDGVRQPDGRTGASLPLPRFDGERVHLGRLPRLRIAAFGDVRPEAPDEPYPLAVASAVFAAAWRGAPPDLLLFLGDTIYVSPPRYDAARDQLAKFVSARASFPGPAYFVVGNHEAFGENLRAFREAVQVAAYYELCADTDAGEAKILVVADNLFNDVEAAWLRAALARPTAITVVARHYPSTNAEFRNAEIARTVAGAAPTLVLAGHTHGYRRPGPREVVAGTGGAPLASAQDATGHVRIEIGPAGGLAIAAFETDGRSVESFTLPAR